MWEIKNNCYFNRQHDVKIFHFPNRKWQIRFSKDEKMARKVTICDDFKGVKQIIKKEYGFKVSEALTNIYFIDDLL